MPSSRQPAPTAAPSGRLAYSVAEACAALGISRPSLYQLIAAGRLHTVMLGGRRVIPVDALTELLKTGQ